jgi:hypothetical protein
VEEVLGLKEKYPEGWQVLGTSHLTPECISDDPLFIQSLAREQLLNKSASETVPLLAGAKGELIYALLVSDRLTEAWVPTLLAARMQFCVGLIAAKMLKKSAVMLNVVHHP